MIWRLQKQLPRGTLKEAGLKIQEKDMPIMLATQVTVNIAPLFTDNTTTNGSGCLKGATVENCQVTQGV